MLEKMTDMESRYQRAQAIEQGIHTKKLVFNTTLYPHWVGGSNTFWYVRDTNVGRQYRLVNAQSGTNEEAFNHTKLANALSDESKQKVDPEKLTLTNLTFNDSLTKCSFQVFDQKWTFDSRDNVCHSEEAHPEGWRVSPDGHKALLIRDCNLWIKELSTGHEKALTKDGEKFRVYAGVPTVYGRQEYPMTVEAIWSPDSKRIFTQVIDTRNVKVGPPLVQHVPVDGGLRPTVLNPERRVAFSGDEQVEAYQFLSIDVEGGGVIQYADYPLCPVHYPPYAGYFTGHRGWWGKDSRHAYFIEQERGTKAFRLVRFDTYSGNAEVLIEEVSDFSVTLIPISHICTLVIPIQETNELIWYSERSGSAHMYLYDLVSGKLKNPITQGDWLVRNVLHYDAQLREIFIQTAGRIPGRNPYYCDICRVNIDTGELTEVVSTDHEYIVCDQRSRISWANQQAKGVSPCGNYVVTTRSRVDDIPESVLLDRDGYKLLSLETADVSGLPKEWHWPEPVMLKAADGITDIYGVLFRPTDFSADKSYPVLDCTYGYSAPVGAFTNNHLGSHHLSAAALAELGFIVVMINNRGNEGLRNTAFNSYQNPLMPMPPALPLKPHKTDCIAGIQQLAARYTYMNIEKVGVVEFGSLPTALSGMLVHPEFYKVGVCRNPKADCRLYTDMGRGHGVWPEFEQRAMNLRGKLFLIAGMLDDVMPVGMTFRMVEALQKANKSFDMLLLPNLGHSTSGYVTRRIWDYVVTHLLEAKPPEDFEVTTGYELLLEEMEAQKHSVES